MNLVASHPLSSWYTEYKKNFMYGNSRNRNKRAKSMLVFICIPEAQLAYCVARASWLVLNEGHLTKTNNFVSVRRMLLVRLSVVRACHYGTRQDFRLLAGNALQRE